MASPSSRATTQATARPRCALLWPGGSPGTRRRASSRTSLALQARAREILPGLPHVLYGHSWGSMTRVVATAPQAQLAGLVLGGIAAQMRGIEASIDREALAALATGAQRAEPAPEEFVGQLFDGFWTASARAPSLTAWVALDEDVADHGRDPLNNFGAPMSARFLQGFVDIYDRANSEAFLSDLPADCPC